MEPFSGIEEINKLSGVHINRVKSPKKAKLSNQEEQLQERLKEEKKLDKKKKINEEEIKASIEKINSTFRLYGVSNQFAIDKKSNTIMVKVIDANTKEIIRELPPEDVLRRLEKMQEYIGLIFDEKF